MGGNAIVLLPPRERIKRISLLLFTLPQNGLGVTRLFFVLLIPDANVIENLVILRGDK